MYGSVFQNRRGACGNVIFTQNRLKSLCFTVFCAIRVSNPGRTLFFNEILKAMISANVCG